MIVEIDELEKIVQLLKLEGKTIVLCNGVFDLIHVGHVKHLKDAKSFGDVLIVSVLNDNDVMIRKGKGRPIYLAKERVEIIDSFNFVDYVIVNESKTGVELISRLKPDVYVKGKDYINKHTEGINAERDAIAGINGKIMYTDTYKSTHEIIKYIKECI